jgi:hypothetical protein
MPSPLLLPSSSAEYTETTTSRRSLLVCEDVLVLLM